MTQTGNSNYQRSMSDQLIRDALVTGYDYSEAAELAGVSARTVRRRMADRAFRAEVRSMQAERTEQLSALLGESGRTAIATLLEALDDENRSIAIRAAQALLGLGQRFRREVEMVDRIDALEERIDRSLGEGKGGH